MVPSRELDKLGGVMAKKKPDTYQFRTINELHAIPMDKIEHFCRDLALWLTICKISELTDGVTKVTTPLDVFGWVDDGKHNVNLNIKVRTE